MEYTFILKLIYQVDKTYTHGSSLPLTTEEESELVSEIIKRKETSLHSNLIDIIHDVVYEFFTGHPEE